MASSDGAVMPLKALLFLHHVWNRREFEIFKQLHEEHTIISPLTKHIMNIWFHQMVSLKLVHLRYQEN